MIRATDSNNPAGGLGRRVWIWGGALALVIIAECVSAALVHQLDQALCSAVKTAPASEQVEAVFTLKNRDDVTCDDIPTADELFESSNPLLREWAMTGQFAAANGANAHEAWLRSVDDPDEVFRCRFLLDFRPGQRRNLRLADLKRFLEDK